MNTHIYIYVIHVYINDFLHVRPGARTRRVFAAAVAVATAAHSPPRRHNSSTMLVPDGAVMTLSVFFRLLPTPSESMRDHFSAFQIVTNISQCETAYGREGTKKINKNNIYTPNARSAASAGRT